MRILANLFLLLFTFFSVSHIALFFPSLLAAYPQLEGIITQLQSITTACAVLLYLATGFNQHLPKRLLYPLFAWILWSLFSFWPLPETTGQFYHLCVGVAQLLTVILLLRRNYRDNESSYLLVPSQFTGPFFSGRTLIIFTIINLIIAPIVCLGMGYNLAVNLIDNGTSGFVQLKPHGLYMSERTYQRDGKTIKLIAMIHLARSGYYTDIVKEIPREKTLILMEGVSDDTNLLKNRFSYGNLADFLGLTPQGHLQLPGRVISREHLLAPSSVLEQNEQGPDMLPADIDISAFNPKTIEVLNALAKYVLNAESPLIGYLEFNQWLQDYGDPDIDKTIMADLLDKRNSAVLSYLPEALQHYDTLVLPWGALHMKGLENAIRDQGFSLSEDQQHLSIDFKKIPYEQILQKLIPQ